MASMKRSETSRLESGSLFRVRARFSASPRSSAGQQQGFQGDAAVRGDQRRHGPSASLDSIAQAMIVVRNRG